MPEPEPDSPGTLTRRRLREDDLCAHIFSASATLVGVCLTVVGVIRAVGPLTNLKTFADELLAIDSIVFLAACILAYLALRTNQQTRRSRIERIADNLFVSALGLMVLICGLIAWELI